MYCCTPRALVANLVAVVFLLSVDLWFARPAQAIEFNDAPPPIHVAHENAVLVITDGEPLLQTVPDTHLQYVVNTNWDLFFDADQELWYLLNELNWYRNSKLHTANWEATDDLPAALEKLPDDNAADEERWEGVRNALPAKKPTAKTLRIFVSDQPAELIVIDGTPVYGTIDPTNIMYVKNTQSYVLLFRNTYYYLVSGRWFSTASLRSPDWQMVSALPDAFNDIPATEQWEPVRAAIPGTKEAAAAIAKAETPETKRLHRTEEVDVEVSYAAAPRFKRIPGTRVEWAENASGDVFRVNSKYYLCEDAIWYESWNANGPWRYAEEVPEDIYDIPPDEPTYRVTYVHVHHYDDDWITYRYWPGYYGMYVHYGVVVFGTGWYYPPYHHYVDNHWWYRPCPYSYGSYAVYYPYHGLYINYGYNYGPYGGYGYGYHYYDPRHHHYVRRHDRDDIKRHNLKVPFNGRSPIDPHNKYRMRDKNDVMNEDPRVKTRPERNRNEREQRDEQTWRDDRYNNRNEREPREERAPKEERIPRNEREPREEHVPKEERIPRNEREPREERIQQPRTEHVPRQERAPREERIQQPRTEHVPRQERAPRNDNSAPPQVIHAPASTYVPPVTAPSQVQSGGQRSSGRQERVEQPPRQERAPRQSRGSDPMEGL